MGLTQDPAHTRFVDVVMKFVNFSPNSEAKVASPKAGKLFTNIFEIPFF